MNAALPVSVSVPSLAMSEQELVSVLSNSLYPGAQSESIKLVISYCRARQLDPMQKPVHIVPMSVKVGDEYVNRDTIMPGIGLYRTDAARTGQYAGKSEPEFGPTVEMEFESERWVRNENGQGRKKVTIPEKVKYPEWCRVTVKRMVDGRMVEFTAKEFWLENYATVGRYSDAPNAMWKRRPFAQLAKCAEAQALRMAFPEAVGAAPTAEEMEGREHVIEGDVIPQGQLSASVAMPTAKSSSEPLPSGEQNESQTASGDAPQGDAKPEQKKASPPLSEGAKNTLLRQMEKSGVTEEALKEAGFDLETMPFSAFNDAMKWVKDQKA